MEKSAKFWSGFADKAKAALRNPVMIGTGLGTGAGLGAGYYSHISQDHLERARRLARQKDIKEGTPEFDKLLEETKAESLRDNLWAGAVAGAALGGVGGAAFDMVRSISSSRKYQEAVRNAYKRQRAHVASGGSPRNFDLEGALREEYDRLFGAGAYARGGHKNFSWSGGGGAGGGGARGGWTGGDGAASAAARNGQDLRKAVGLSGSEKTKAEAKKKFREAARKVHPDFGGSESKMKDINAAWDDLQKSEWYQKLAFWRGFKLEAQAR